MQLFLNTYGTYLHKKGELFVVKIDSKKKKISPKRISSIIITNAATISTDAIQLALEYNIDVVFLDKFGNPYGRIWFPKVGSTTFIRRRQLEIYMKDEGLEIVKNWVEIKIQNQIDFIKLLLSKRTGVEDLNSKVQSMIELKDKLHKLEGKLSENSSSLMGYEGNVSKHYFGILAELIPDKYKFKGRSSRPAKDVFNAFLNYGYGVMYNRVERALVIAGLDPYVGLLHTDNYNKKSLVFDFIEQYRTLIDQPIFYLFSRHKVKDEYSQKVKNGISISDEGKKLLITEIIEHFDSQFRYNKKNMKRIAQIQADAHSFANRLIKGEQDVNLGNV